MERRYEIFLSSTSLDLSNQRDLIRNYIVLCKHFPTGMEGFVGGTRTPWEHIKQAITRCDYFVLLIGAKYGSLFPGTKSSFTEKEFELAKALKKEILVLRLSDAALGNLKPEEQETDPEKREAILNFRSFLGENHHVIDWNDSTQLKERLQGGLLNWIQENPVEGGWVRSSEYERKRSENHILKFHFNRLNPYHNLMFESPLYGELQRPPDSVAHIAFVIRETIETFATRIIDDDVRLYFAVREVPKPGIQKTGNVQKSEPVYRIAVWSSKNPTWDPPETLKGKSNIHQVYCTGELKAVDDATKRLDSAENMNIPVSGESSVVAAPVFGIGNIPVGVVGLSSPQVGRAKIHRATVEEIGVLFSSLFLARFESMRPSGTLGSILSFVKSRKLQQEVYARQLRREIMKPFLT